MIKEKLAALLNVKSIVTLVLTGVFAWLSINGTITGQEFQTVFSVVIAFYFGTQYQKRAEVVEKNNKKGNKKFFFRISIVTYRKKLFCYLIDVYMRIFSTFLEKLPCADYTATHLPVWELHPLINSFSTLFN